MNIHTDRLTQHVYRYMYMHSVMLQCICEKYQLKKFWSLRTVSSHSNGFAIFIFIVSDHDKNFFTTKFIKLQYTLLQAQMIAVYIALQALQWRLHRSICVGMVRMVLMHYLRSEPQPAFFNPRRDTWRKQKMRVFLVLRYCKKSWNVSAPAAKQTYFSTNFWSLRTVSSHSKRLLKICDENSLQVSFFIVLDDQENFFSTTFRSGVLWSNKVMH